MKRIQKVISILMLLSLLAGCTAVSDPAPALPNAALPAQPKPVTPTAPPATPTPLPNCTGPTETAVATLPPVLDYERVNTYPHRTDVHTQGLLWADGVLYESGGWYGYGILQRVALPGGETLQETTYSGLADGFFGEGIVIWEDRILQLTWQARTGFIYDRETFNPIGEFSYETEGWGLTENGRCLIMSDGTDTLTFRDPDSFAVLGSLPVFDNNGPVARLNELEFVNGDIYANVWLTDRIARIDAASGAVTGWLDFGPFVSEAKSAFPNAKELNGIAYNPETSTFYVTGKYWPTLYEIRVSE